MLQQTQVSTVLPYYERFLTRFPTVHALAAASSDDVMALWSGLGYYSRARHLHRCAQQVAHEHGGQFPHTAHALESLAGIGRSTAAAIAAFCHGERAAILDGNVKRVLCRCFGIADDLAQPAALRRLWALAEDLLPTDNLAEDMPRYTQGLMDLGATVCTLRQPACLRCPLSDQCVAYRERAVDQYPRKRSRKERERQSLWLLHARQAGAVWLEKRPPTGIWAGLHCLPVFKSRDQLLEALPAAARAHTVEHGSIKHMLTHRELHLTMVSVQLDGQGALDGCKGQWYAEQWAQKGLPAPVRLFLQTVEETENPSVQQLAMAQQRLPLA